jgi:hypothetical protein
LVLPSVLAVASVSGSIASCSDRSTAPDAGIRDPRMLVDAGEALVDAHRELDAAAADAAIDVAIDAAIDAPRDAPPDTPT